MTQLWLKGSCQIRHLGCIAVCWRRLRSNHPFRYACDRAEKATSQCSHLPRSCQGEIRTGNTWRVHRSAFQAPEIRLGLHGHHQQRRRVRHRRELRNPRLRTHPKQRSSIATYSILGRGKKPARPSREAGTHTLRHAGAVLHHFVANDSVRNGLCIWRGVFHRLDCCGDYLAILFYWGRCFLAAVAE
jgi:hypothetical protein